MQITKEETGALTATIKLLIGKEDYEEKVNKTLKDYQHKASIPGFRPGKVPFGLIAKMYRKGILLDEINHILAEKLQDYIEDSNLRLIGNPIANKEKAAGIDLDSQSEFEFYFDIGLAPEFELNLSENLSVDYYKITATEKMIDEQIHELQHRMAGHSHDEQHGDNEEHHDEHLPELDEKFFSQVFPGEEIKNESLFRDKVKETIERSLIKESERYFMNSVIEKLVRDTIFELPDQFLRKMLKENEEGKLSDEDIEKQYVNFSNSVRWQLIESRLIQEYNLRVEENEIRNIVRSYFTGNLVNPAEDPERDERLNKIVDSVLSNKEESGRIHDQLFDQKLLDLFRNRLKPENKEVDYDEFIKMVTQKNA
jgi:FKBP-type peptidyl-prolyl cis-trans isomerase (trigger factor)